MKETRSTNFDDNLFFSIWSLLAEIGGVCIIESYKLILLNIVYFRNKI